MSKVNLESVRPHVEVLKWAKDKQRELKDMEQSARDAIEEAMGGNDIGELDGETVITWTTHKKRQFQQKAFAEAHPELAEEYTNLVEARTFKVL